MAYYNHEAQYNNKILYNAYPAVSGQPLLQLAQYNQTKYNSQVFYNTLVRTSQQFKTYYNNKIKYNGRVYYNKTSVSVETYTEMLQSDISITDGVINIKIYSPELLLSVLNIEISSVSTEQSYFEQLLSDAIFDSNLLVIYGQIVVEVLLSNITSDLTIDSRQNYLDQVITNISSESILDLLIYEFLKDVVEIESTVNDVVPLVTELMTITLESQSQLLSFIKIIIGSEVVKDIAQSESFASVSVFLELAVINFLLEIVDTIDFDLNIT